MAYTLNTNRYTDIDMGLIAGDDDTSVVDLSAISARRFFIWLGGVGMTAFTIEFKIQIATGAGFTAFYPIVAVDAAGTNSLIFDETSGNAGGGIFSIDFPLLGGNLQGTVTNFNGSFLQVSLLY